LNLKSLDDIIKKHNIYQVKMDFFYQTIIFLPAIIIALTVHEYAHAWVAYKLGDDTAKAHGRLTFNPLAHLDPIGTLTLIFFRFGWGKPVPINEYNFKNPVVGTALSSLAGPTSNLIMAGVGTGIFHLTFGINEILSLFLISFVIINIVLMIFNLLPIPPLDGHKVVRALLPESIRYYWESIERFSPFLLIGVVIVFVYTGFMGTIIFSILRFLIPEYILYL
jgi:Zn-dependent protease